MIKLLRRIVCTTLLVAAAVAASSASAMVPASPSSGRSEGSTPSPGAVGLASAAAVDRAGPSQQTAQQSSVHRHKRGRHRRRSGTSGPKPLAPIPLSAPPGHQRDSATRDVEVYRDFLPGGQAAAFQMKTGASGSAGLIHILCR